MADFEWEAADAQGRIQRGRLQATGLAQAHQQLSARGLVPLQLDPVGGMQGLAGAGPGSNAGSRPSGSAASLSSTRPATKAAAGLQTSTAPSTASAHRGWRARRPVQSADVLAILSELAVMLRAGLPLDRALRVLRGMDHRPAVAQLIEQILESVKGGAALSKALADHPRLFGPFVVQMVRAGEASGQMSEVLTRLVEHLERLAALRASLISALTYPAILLTVAVLSVMAMLGFVVPQFEALFLDMGDALPWPTQIVLALSQGFQTWGLWWIVGGFLALAGLLRALQNPAVRARLQAWALRLPVVGGLLLRADLGRFARTLGTLLTQGVSLLPALEIARQTVGAEPVRAALEPVAAAMKGGGRMAEALQNTGLVAPLAINLVRVGEETGRLDAMLLEIARLADRDVENGIKRGLSLVEPLLIIVLGLLIAVIIVAILMGILSVNDLAI